MDSVYSPEYRMLHKKTGTEATKKESIKKIPMDKEELQQVRGNY